jgi:ppGpp synthetase/RelA/SpoT-type nucleotidyltranferase
MDLNRIEKLINEYRDKRNIYSEFTLLCHDQILNFITKQRLNGLLDKVSLRTKEEPSLKKKLESGQINPKKISEIRDLSGVRAIFLLDNEASKFLTVAMFEKQIGVLEIVSFKRVYRNAGFLGQYIILKISEDTLKDPSYEKFKNCLCELQVTDSLQNTRAEIYHRTIYKNRNRLLEFAPEQLVKLEARYEELIEKPLRQVSNNINYLYEAGIKLANGSSAFSDDVYEEIDNCQTLDQIWSVLNKINEQIRTFGPKFENIERFFQSITSIYDKIQFSEKDSNEEASNWTSKDIVKKLVSIMSELFYQLPEHVCDFFEKIILLTPQHTQIIFDQLKKLSIFDRNIISRVGYSYYLIIANWIEKASSRHSKIQWIGINLLSQLLDLKLSGTSLVDVDVISFQHGPPPYSEELKDLRTKCLNILMSMYIEEGNLKSKIQLIETMFQAIIHRFFPDQLTLKYRLMLEEESNYITKRFKKNIRSMQLVEKITLETGMRDVRNRFAKDGYNTSLLDEFLSKNFQTKDYLFVRSLVGKDIHNACLKEDFSKSDVSGLVGGITSRNWFSWKRRICAIGRLYPDLHSDQFDSFEEFLKELAISKPTYALELLNECFNDLSWFCRVLIPIIFESPKRFELENLLLSYLKKDIHQDAIVQGFFQIKTPPHYFLEPILKSLLRTNDLHLVYVLACSLKKVVNFWDQKSIIDAFFTCISILSNNNKFRWTRDILYEGNRLIQILSFDELFKVLDILVEIDHVDECVDYVLAKVAENKPEEIINYFINRKKVKKNEQKSFSIWPGRMVKLLNVINKLTLSALSDFYLKLKNLKDEESRFIFKLLPTFMSHSSVSMLQLIEQYIEGKKENLNLIMKILEQYYGDVSLYLHYKRIISISKLSKIEQLKICGQLLFVGEWHGRDGMLSQLEQRKELVNSWSSEDDGTDLKDFLKIFNEAIDTAIKDEKTKFSRDVFIEKASFEDKI